MILLTFHATLRKFVREFPYAKKKNRKREERHAESFGRRCSGVESERGQASINRDIISVGNREREGGGDIHHHCQQGRTHQVPSRISVETPSFSCAKGKVNVHEQWMNE